MQIFSRSQFSFYFTIIETITRLFEKDFQETAPSINRESSVKTFIPATKKKHTKYFLYLFQFISETNLPPRFTLQSTLFPIIAPMEDFDYPDVLHGDVSWRGKLDTSIEITRFPCSFSLSAP